MALERQSIEKKDFPIGRRGYDSEAVDNHLSSIAEEVEALKRSSRKRTETLASTASEQVRSIVEAAETSAAQIQSQAEDDAREIRSEANTEASRAREQATEQARDYVGQVSEATAVMLQRIDAMESELTALVESLRTGSNRLNADLQLLQGNLSELRDSTVPRRFVEGEQGDEGLPGEAGDLEPSFADEPLEEHPPAAPEIEQPQLDEAPPEHDLVEVAPPPAESPTLAGEGSDDTEGARLIALNMALNGTPREETERYLEANFRLEDRAALLDEVYSSVEG